MTEKKNSATASIKRCTWLATKIAFFVLMPICAIGWLAVAGLLIYKSYEIGVSPVEIVRAISFAKVFDGLIALVALVVVGVAFSAIAGAIIGTLSVCLGRVAYRSHDSRSAQLRA